MLVPHGARIAAVAAVAWLAVAVAVAEIASGRGRGTGGGWLGRLVQYHKNAFLNDYEKYNSKMVNIEASIEPASEGYEDSPAWDESSVLRLLELVSVSRAASAQPVRRALRHALRPTRRYMPYIPRGKASLDLFPSLAKNIPNFIYYDYSNETSEEEASEARHQREWERDRKHATVAPRNVTEQEKRAVLVVRNPVEARLPSARISVTLLRKIMEARAGAARASSPSTRRTFTWRRRVNATTTPAKNANETTTPATEANATTTASADTTALAAGSRNTSDATSPSATEPAPLTATPAAG